MSHLAFVVLGTQSLRSGISCMYLMHRLERWAGVCQEEAPTKGLWNRGGSCQWGGGLEGFPEEEGFLFEHE